jgi:hypothetical protein
MKPFAKQALNATLKNVYLGVYNQRFSILIDFDIAERNLLVPISMTLPEARELMKGVQEMIDSAERFTQAG